jgi:hypothetical protein
MEQALAMCLLEQQLAQQGAPVGKPAPAAPKKP